MFHFRTVTLGINIIISSLHYELAALVHVFDINLVLHVWVISLLRVGLINQYVPAPRPYQTYVLYELSLAYWQASFKSKIFHYVKGKDLIRQPLFVLSKLMPPMNQNQKSQSMKRTPSTMTTVSKYYTRFRCGSI